MGRIRKCGFLRIFTYMDNGLIWVRLTKGSISIVNCSRPHERNKIRLVNKEIKTVKFQLYLKLRKYITIFNAYHQYIIIIYIALLFINSIGGIL